MIHFFIKKSKNLEKKKNDLIFPLSCQNVYFHISFQSFQKPSEISDRMGLESSLKSSSSNALPPPNQAFLCNNTFPLLRGTATLLEQARGPILHHVFHILFLTLVIIIFVHFFFFETTKTYQTQTLHTFKEMSINRH